jgi:hypothetical protein
MVTQGDTAARRADGSTARRAVGERRAPAIVASAPAGALLPRLVTVAMTGAYLSLGEDTVAELLAAGIFVRVTVPAPVAAKRRGGAIRKVLIDRHQLDAAVTAWTRVAEEPR